MKVLDKDNNEIDLKQTFEDDEDISFRSAEESDYDELNHYVDDSGDAPADEDAEESDDFEEDSDDFDDAGSGMDFALDGADMDDDF